MSAPPLTSTGGIPPTASRADLVIDDHVRVPSWVNDFEAFRRWTWSAEYPPFGRFSFLDDCLWADVTMEELFTHNQVKAAIALAIGSLLATTPLGRYVPDRMLWTNRKSQVATEPDGLFYRWDAVRTGRLTLVTGADGRVMELEGSSDMVMEIVSRSSVRKDTEVLRRLYHAAGVREYWLVDVRDDAKSFEILRWEANGYAEGARRDRWRYSHVFSTWFQLTVMTDLLGRPQYRLDWQSESTESREE